MRQPNVNRALDGQAAALATAWSRCVCGGCDLRNGQDAKEQKAISCQTNANCLSDTAELFPSLVVLGLQISERESHNCVFHRVRKYRGENQHFLRRVWVHSLFLGVTPELHTARDSCPEDHLFHAHALAGIGREFTKLLNCVLNLTRRAVFHLINKAEDLKDPRESLPVSAVTSFQFHHGNHQCSSCGLTFCLKGLYRVTEQRDIPFIS